MPKILAGLTLALLLTLGVSSQVSAQTSYTCDEGGNPPSGTISGDAVITQSGSCTLSNGVTATGKISVSADGAINVQNSLSAGTSLTIDGGSTVTTKNVTASGNVQILGGDVVTVNGDINDSGYVIVVSSQKEVSLQDINDYGGSFGEVRIFSNSSSPFLIGESGDANGVGAVDISSSSSVGFAYFSNAGSGGITFQNGNINVGNSGGVAGKVVLDARSGSGPIVLDGGSIDVDGQSSYESGSIDLFANATAGIQVTSETTLSSSQSTSVATPDTDHFVSLITGQISLSADLNMIVNGNGRTDLGGVVASILPMGAITFTATDDPSVAIVPNGNNASWSGAPESITGSGTMTISVNGSTAPVRIAGDSLTITAPVTILAYGANNPVYVLSTDGAGNNNAMTVGSLQVFDQTQAAGQTAGTVNLTASQISSVANSVYLSADGSNDGDGGTVNVSVASGTLPLGSGSNEIQLSSGSNSGDAGTINVTGQAASVTIDSGALNANVSGGDGDGGTIKVTSQSIATAGSNATIFATGSGTGDGGTISLTVSGAGKTLSIAGDGSSFALVAQGGDTGNGGTVNLSAPTVALDGGSIFVNAQSDGDGGSINVANTGTLNVAVDYEMTANGAGDGDGGNISLNAGAINIADDYTPTFQVNGAGTGVGGNITFTTTSQIDLGQSAITADGGDTGTGGNVTVNSNTADILGTATISAYGGCSDGDGGDVTLTGNNVAIAGIGASSGGDPTTSSCMAVAAKTSLVDKVKLKRPAQ